MLRAVATRVRSSMSLAATAAARGSRGARVASLGTPRAFARPLVGGARVFARDRSLPRSPSTPPRRGAFRVSRRVSRRFVAATDDGAEPKPTPVASSVYAHPELYELAFGFRDFDSEAAFLARMCRAHAGRAMRSVLELGAGPAWHSVSCVTTQGPCVAVALDNTPAMLKRASRRALERGVDRATGGGARAGPRDREEVDRRERPAREGGAAREKARVTEARLRLFWLPPVPKRPRSRGARDSLRTDFSRHHLRRSLSSNETSTSYND